MALLCAGALVVAACVGGCGSGGLVDGNGAAPPDRADATPDGGGTLPDASPDEAPDRAPLDNPPDPGPPPDHDGLSDELRAALARSTFHVGGIACGRVSEGSGFAVAADLVATTAHTVVGLDEISLSGADGLSATAVPVAFDAINDLALLEVRSAVFEPLPLGDAPDGTVGALLGWDDESTFDPTPYRIDRPITVRIEAVATGDQAERVERRSWLLAAEVEPGDSGAALVDAEGQVVGIVYAATRRGSAVGYATRAEALAELIAAGRNPETVVPAC